MQNLKLTIIAILTVLSLNQAKSATFSPIESEQIPSGMPYTIELPTVEDPNLFTGKQVAILASHGVEEPELTFPYKYLIDRGAQVDILVPNWTPQGIVVSLFLKPHLWVTADGTFQNGLKQNYDLIILTGGAWNAQVVKTDHDALNLITRHYRAGRAIAAICAGTEILISSGLSRGLNLTGPSYARMNLVNSGATFADQAMVIDQKILTSRDPNDLPSFVTGLRSLLTGKQN